MAKQKQSALEMVLLRNLYYRDAYKRVVICVFIALVVNILLIAGVIYKSFTPPAPQYFPTTADGRIILEHPLSDPVESDAQVLAWIANVTQTMYRMDYIHWQAQLQETANYFTPLGWRGYRTSLDKSNNLNTLINFKMVTKVQLTGVPQILQREVIQGRYTWMIKVPVLVQYLSPVHSTINQSLDITFIVTRVPVQQDPDRIAVNNFLPQTSGA